MTVASTIPKHIYAGNGVSTVWPYTFKLFDAEHLHILITEPDGVAVEITNGFALDMAAQTLTYPITAEDPAEQIEILASGWKITLLRTVPYTQEMDLVHQGAYNAETLEAAHDRAVMLIQQVKEQVDRALVLPVDSNEDPVDMMVEILNARDDAEAAQMAAEIAKSNAETAETHAQLAETNAEAAQTEAEIARDVAVNAKDVTLLAKTAAETAETNADTSEANARSAQVAAEAARDTAVSAKDAALFARTASETAETNAELAKTAAETAETNAEAAESNAESAEAKAKKWSNEVENTEVESGLYSAKHWAAKAQDYAESLDLTWDNVTNKPSVFPPEEHNHDSIYAPFIKATCDTAAATAAKIVTIADYTLAAGHMFAIAFTLGNTVTAPTININNTGAKNIKLGATNASTTTFTLAAASVALLYYDGISFRLFGSYRTSDTDTDTAVSQTLSTLDGEYALLAKASTAMTTTTSTSVFCALVKLNPSTGTLTAVRLIGDTLTSTVADGTAPLTITSRNKVNNLNADLLDGKEAADFAEVSHAHATLYSALAHDHTGVYAPASHAHAIADVTNLQTTLNGKSPTSHDHSSLYAVLSHNHTGVYSVTDHNHDAAYAPISHTHAYLSDLNADTTPQLGGTLDCNSKPVVFDMYTITGTVIDVANGQYQEIVLSANITVTIPAPADSKFTSFHLFIQQSSTVKTVTFPSTTTVKWAGGIAPDLSIASGYYGLYFAYRNNVWHGGWARYY